MRRAGGFDGWVVLGHSWARTWCVTRRIILSGEMPPSTYPVVRSAFADRVRSIVGVDGHGLRKDRTWFQAYESSRYLEADIEIDGNQAFTAH
ncbi:hypothetical protein ACQPW1_29995 [Nocardia sp. CA-128927]|uniref:hypothetical protein n=1 Tax=Nocardia sp. CA-128927 TaxID=3239975 RepID=UPI003D970239